MMNAKRIVLGPDSPSMGLVERIAREAGVEVVPARIHVPDDPPVPGVSPASLCVTTATAYRADWPEPQAGDVWVECGPAGWSMDPVGDCETAWTEAAKRGGVTLIRPDPAAPPSEFLPASTVGRFMLILQDDPCRWMQQERGAWMIVTVKHGAIRYAFANNDVLHTAAAPHWREAALRGECPGVDPAEFAAWLAKEEGN